MISFFVGVPGSGKTYYAVDKIYNNFSNDKEAIRDKKATYNICYTNINEFNFDKVKNVYKLDFDDLKEKLAELYLLYKSKASDDELIKKCQEYNILNALFVIDEAHNYFDVKDTVLIWWLSYHRHLYHEIILITQNLSLIESKYKSFSEFFYKAFPQSLTLIKTHFKYNVYCSSRMSQASKSGSIKIKRNKKVFELYKSGDSINSQNVILKFLTFSFFLLIFLVFSFYFFISSKSSDQNVSEQHNIPVTYQDKKDNNVYAAEQSQITMQDHFNYVSSQLLVLSCNSSYCYNKDITLPVPLVSYFIKNNDLSLLYTNEINQNYLKMYFSISEDFYKFLISSKGVKEDEKKQIPTNFLNPLSSPVSQSR